MLVLAYFTLAMKTLHLPSDMTIRERKRLDGYRGKIHGKPLEEVSCFLIGQLGRNSNVSKDLISGTEIIEKACAVIRDVSLYVGGRWILVECHKKKELIQYYEKNKFEYLMEQSDRDVPMIQLIRKIELSR